MANTITKYEDVALRLEELISRGVYEPGERLPSIRDLHRELRVSVNTARETYRLLEARGVVEARAQSGHYVRLGPPLCANCEMSFPDIFSEGWVREVRPDRLTHQILADGGREGWIDLATAVAPEHILPTRRVAEITARLLRTHPEKMSRYYLPPGPLELRQEIAKRLFRGGVSIGVDHIQVTAGCLEAVFLSLLAVCRPQDAVIIESPAFFLFYQLLERLNLRAVELPSRPEIGIDPEELEVVLQRDRRSAGGGSIRAALLIPNFSNPIGALMPIQNKVRVAEILDRYGVFLIEDDMYGEMAYGDQRPPSLAKWANPDRTLLCASFSKSIAPGYRVGWVATGGALSSEIQHAKLVTSEAISAPAAHGVAAFLASGGYDRSLRAAHRHYRASVAAMRQAIDESFPIGTRSTLPCGGLVVWVVMPQQVDAVELYERARRERIVFAPGPIFSLGGSYSNCMRLNAAAWGPKTDRAVRRLGELAWELSERSEMDYPNIPIGKGTWSSSRKMR